MYHDLSWKLQCFWQYRWLDLGFIWNHPGLPAHNRNAGRTQSPIFLCICFLSDISFMGCIVQFNDGNNAGIFVTYYEICTHTVNPIIPWLKIITLFDQKKPGKLYLGKDYVLRQGISKAKVQNLLRLCKYLWCTKRPNLIGPSAPSLTVKYLKTVVGTMPYEEVYKFDNG